MMRMALGFCRCSIISNQSSSSVTLCCTDKQYLDKHSPVPFEPSIEEELLAMGSVHEGPRSTSSSRSCAKGPGRPLRSQPARLTGKATDRSRMLQLRDVVISRATESSHRIQSNCRGASVAAPPAKNARDEAIIASTRHKKRKRADSDVNTDFVPASSASGRVGRVGRPDSPTW